MGDEAGSTVPVGVEAAISVDVGGTDVHVSATVGVVAGTPHPTTNGMRNARPIIGNDFLLSISVSVLYQGENQGEIQPLNETVEKPELGLTISARLLMC